MFKMFPLAYMIILIYLQGKTSEANVRFICPPPTSPGSDQKSYCCHSDSSFVSKDITVLHPGLFTVSFEETKFEQGSPFRISLVDNSRQITNTTDMNSTSGIVHEAEKSCLLLDHIPHNNHAVITQDCSQKGNDYPLGVCNGSTYHITIRVPDVSCNDCILLLQQVVTNQEHHVCDVTHHNGTINDTKCITYSSCARVRIRPTVSGQGKNVGHCSNYLDNLPGDWPYRPQDVFQTDQGAIVSLDLLHTDVNIEIPSGLNLGPIDRVEIHHNLTKIWNLTITAINIIDNSGAVKVLWKNLTNTQLNNLKAGQLVLNIVGSEKSLAADIINSSQHFSEGRLSALHDLYSESGWLTSHKFLGPHAEDPAAAIPWGQCVSEASYYMAFLQSVHVTSHGILGMTILETRAYITAVLHVESEVVQIIKIKGPDLVGVPAIEITVPPSFNGVVQAALDITDKLPYMKTVQFFKTVEVETDKEDAVLIGDLEEGMYTVLRDDTGDVRGMGAFQFTQGQWLKVEVVLNELSPTVQSAWKQGPDNELSPAIQSVWLHGPDCKLVDLTRQTQHCTQTFCCLEGMIHEMTSELLLHLMKGQVVLYVTGVNTTISGEVLGSPLGYCRILDGTCDSKFHQFSMNGLGVEQRVGDQEQTNASTWSAVEAYVLDRANVLHYCVQVDNVNMSGKLFTAGLVSSTRKIDSVLFQPLEFSNSYIACDHIPLEDSHLSQTSLNVVISDTDHQLSSHDMPAIVRAECIASKIHEVGTESHHWSPDSSPLRDVYAVISDQLRFAFGANTTLFQMASKEAMMSCDFKSALEFSPLDLGDNKRVYYYNLNRTGSFYFADFDTCNTSSPLKLFVHVTDGVRKSREKNHDEFCSRSVYIIWREKQLQKWKEPDVSSPVLIGLVLGLASAGVFLLWQGFRLKHVPESFRSNSDNVFIRF